MKQFSFICQYEVGALKLLCEDHLIKSLNLENVAERLYLAHRHSAKHLKAATADYVTR